MEVHTFNHSSGGREGEDRQRQVGLCEFKTSLVYRVSSRTARATQRNPVSKNQNRTNLIRNPKQSKQ